MTYQNFNAAPINAHNDHLPTMHKDDAATSQYAVCSCGALLSLWMPIEVNMTYEEFEVVYAAHLQTLGYTP